VKVERAPQTGPAPIRRMRFVVLAGVLACWATLITGRLVLLQVFQHHYWMVEADQQQLRTVALAPRRGILYDRNLHELAVTVQVDSVFAVPTEVADKAGMAAKLEKIVHRDPTDKFTSKEQIAARLHGRNFVWIARKIDTATSAELRKANFKGIYFQKEFKRFYPDKEMAAQVLGYVGTDDTGLGGIELKFEDDLHGEPGRMFTAVDARRQTLASVEHDPAPGNSMVLTIDQNIQFIAERALDKVVSETHALRGTVVVEDPHTGEILALATRPTFNPNDFRHVGHDLLTDPAVSDIYEPGSTFKLVTYSAALDHGAAKPTDDIDCQGGKITLFGRTIHDDKSDMGMGVVTVQRALERSSDVAAVKLALRLGQGTFYGYMRGFGFGDRTGIELPAETRGLLRTPPRWSATSIGSLAIGQEVGVTPIQLAAMVSTIANGGTYLPPHILKAEAMGGEESKLKADPYMLRNTVASPLPEGSHRVISEMTSAQMRKMMEGVVVNGTGKEAALNGYSAGGKTGTAQKIDVVTHTYSKTKHIASFVGIAPVSNPAITVAVVIDSPEGNYYGATVSAPVFKEIAQQTLEYLGVPNDEEIRAAPVKSKIQPQELEEDASGDSVGDSAWLTAGISELPKTDPLRAGLDGSSEIAAKSGSGIAERTAVNAKDSGVHLVPEAMAASAAGNGGADEVGAKTETATSGENGKSEASAGMVIVPVLVGKPVREAVEMARGAGLTVEVMGSGLAEAQAPKAGTRVPTGTEVRVRFAR
jgi:cell division protein FtsI (penicillin-binding protein 3)